MGCQGLVVCSRLQIFKVPELIDGIWQHNYEPGS